MITHALQSQVTSRFAKPLNIGRTSFHLTDNRPEAVAQRKLQDDITNTRLEKSVIQRRIVSTPIAAGPQIFIRRGRSGPHNTAANRIALAALRNQRLLAPNHIARNVNNEYENAIGGGLPIPAWVAPPLHMSHHISDHTVQDTVATAANNVNLGMGAAAWGPVNNMIAGIDPALAPVAPPLLFMTAANPAHANALAIVAALGAGPIPHNPASRATLTNLASSIANSPMNLHHGLGSANMSIGGHGDPNSHVNPVAPALAGMPALNRRLSWRSNQMINNVGAAALNYRSHAMAMAMPGTVANAQAGMIPPPPAGAPVLVHSSGSNAHFTTLL
ncbi:hypothetical protein [Flavobacterium sp.]|uniref:hypothetical protein n=1 Tax=Flavobacterium sp. TaxID=239 RepID=UPI0039E63103